MLSFVMSTKMRNFNCMWLLRPQIEVVSYAVTDEAVAQHGKRRLERTSAMPCIA